MGRIRRLPSSVVNRIAAGEVVERPASALKELLENALDAGASRIDVVLEQGGIGLVRVSDDGAGIDADDLPLAVSNHATSKLATADDLADVRTFGFRGEALASIGEVSRLVIRSRTPTAPGGAMVVVDGGVVADVEPCPMAVGTTVEVHQLFARIPARRAFLKAPQTEWSHACETFVRTALARSDVSFSLTHGKRRVHDLPAVGRWLDRIGGLAGQSLVPRLVPFHGEADGLSVEGYAGRPDCDAGSGRLQYLFVNGRPFRDRSVLHAIQESYRGLLLSGRQPVVFLRLSIDPSLVDVNVHPAKTEVRFRDAARVHQLILASLRTAFLSADLTVPLVPPVAGGETGREADTPPSADGTLSRAASPDPDRFGGGPVRGFSSPADFRPFPDRPPPFPGALGEGDGPSADIHRGAPHSPPESAPLGRPERDPVVVQMHDRYLVVETPEGIEVIDQHALHERILFARLREEVARGGLEVQRLLVPERVDVTPDAFERVGEHIGILRSAGLDVEPFGGTTVLVRSRPALAGRASSTALLGEALERLGTVGRCPPERLLDEVLHGMACRAAIKAGDPLSEAEMRALVRDRKTTEDGHHCPHGRPTTLALSRQELDRQFRRT
jgi:DNA mismatch repair protein MutL